MCVCVCEDDICSCPPCQCNTSVCVICDFSHTSLNRRPQPCLTTTCVCPCVLVRTSFSLRNRFTLKFTVDVRNLDPQTNTHTQMCVCESICACEWTREAVVWVIECDWTYVYSHWSGSLPKFSQAQQGVHGELKPCPSMPLSHRLLLLHDCVQNYGLFPIECITQCPNVLSSAPLGSISGMVKVVYS